MLASSMVCRRFCSRTRASSFARSRSRPPKYTAAKSASRERSRQERRPAEAALLRTHAGQDAAPQRGRGSGGRRRAAQQRHHLPRAFDFLHTDLAFAIQVRADLAALRLVGHADGVQFVMFAQFVAVHAGTAAPSSSRKFFSAARTQVFTVPSGWPMRSAISV